MDLPTKVIARIRTRFFPFSFFILLAWSLTAPFSVSGKVPEGPPSTAERSSPDFDFSAGVESYRAGLFDRAIRLFMKIIQEYPGDPRLMEAQWMLAKAYEAKGDLPSAVEEYRSFLNNFPSTPHREEALLRLSTNRRALHLSTSRGAESPPGRPKADRRILGGQFLLFPADTYSALDRLLGELKGSGMNTVIVRVFQNRGDRQYPFVSKKGPDVGVYFNTSHAPVVEDILSPLVEMAHRHHLRIYAWMTTRAMDWIPAERPWFDLSYDPLRRGLVRSKRLDLFNPEVSEYLENIYKDLASYPIDGILFQDDLVYRHREGFSPFAVSRFQKDFGVAPSIGEIYEQAGEGYKPLFWRWAGWKSREILKTAGDIMAASRSVHRDLSFILNMNYETVLDPVHALAWFSQDLMEAQKYPFDYFAVMAYHRQIGKEMDRGTDGAMDLVRLIGEKMAQAVEDPSRILIKMQAVDWETGMPVPQRELEVLSTRLSDVPGVGIAYVFNGHPPPLAFLLEVFNRYEEATQHLTNQ